MLLFICLAAALGFTALMLGISHILTMNWSRAGDQIQKNVTVSADGEHNFDIPLTALQTDKHVDVTLDVSELKLIYIVSDVDATIEWNNNAGADGALTLTADVPIAWTSDQGAENPLGSTDITGMYITNTEDEAGTVKLRFLEDDTHNLPLGGVALGVAVQAPAPIQRARSRKRAETSSGGDPFMADMLQDAASWLTEQRTAHMTRLIQYRRGTSSQSGIPATVGQTLMKLGDDFGGVQLARTDRDYLIATADLKLDGDAILPAKGDVIADDNEGDGKTYLYEVRAPGDEPPWRWSDFYHLTLRIHTKLIGTS